MPHLAEKTICLSIYGCNIFSGEIMCANTACLIQRTFQNWSTIGISITQVRLYILMSIKHLSFTASCVIKDKFIKSFTVSCTVYIKYYSITEFLLLFILSLFTQQSY